jgi:hypothetical protein
MTLMCQLCANYALSSTNTHTYLTVYLKPSMDSSRLTLKSIYIKQDTAITFTLPTAAPHIEHLLSETEVPYSRIFIFTLPKYHHPSITSSEDWGSA